MLKRKLWRLGAKEIQYVSQAIKKGLIGEYTRLLEREFAKKFGVKFAIAVNSGNSALHCALAAVGVGPGDEVIVPPLTFASPALATLYLGAKPVFADINKETFNIDPLEIEKKITRRTKAIIAVSLYGLPPEMGAIMKIARKHNLKVIEDDAECVLGKYPKGKLAGSISDMAIFSFERSKHLTCGAGGMVVTNSRKLAEVARKFSILGYRTLSARGDSFKNNLDLVQHPDFKRHEILGYNYRLPEVCASIALAQLEKAEMLVRMRQKIAKLYDQAILGCTWLKPQHIPSQYISSYWTYVLELDTTKVKWDEFRNLFVKNGGERYYAAWSVVYLEPLFKKLGYSAGLCPKAEMVQKKLIQLKTNFGDLRYAKKQAEIIKKTIDFLDKRNKR